MATTKELRRLVAAAAHDADLFAVARESESMLSPAELAVIYWLTRLCYSGSGNIAELGSYIGGTTQVFGEALRRIGIDEPRLEVYDFFQHSNASRSRLSNHPLADNHTFFPIWEENTRPYRDLIDLHRGDLRETASDSTKELEVLYVDIVKSDVLINPLMSHFLPRLRPGGILLQQDYYHFQSPWIVYATEHIIDRFDILGTVSNQMLVLRLAASESISTHEVVDYVVGMRWEEKLDLMKRAIDRYKGVRAALLEVSRLNLALDLPDYNVASECERIRRKYGHHPRPMRYLAAVEARYQQNDRGRAAMW